MGSCDITKNLINIDQIKIIQFCLKIYDLWRHPHLWVGLWVDGYIDGWGHVKSTKSQINLDLIQIIQFCIKIYDLWRHPHLMGWCMDALVDEWVDR